MNKKNLFKIFSLLCSASFVFNATLYSEGKNDTKTNEIITIGKIDGESSKDLSVVTVRFNKKPNLGKIIIEEHGSFLQIQIPNSITPNPGKFIDSNSPIIKKIAVFQISDTTSALRLFLTEDASIVREATEAEILNKRLVITTDHKALHKQIASVPMKIEIKDPTEPLASESVTHQAIAAIEKAASIGKSKFDLNGKLYKVAGFLGVMLLFLIATLVLKPLLERRKKASLGEDYTPMKLLGDLSLSPKQKLSLVQIGGEQILVSVSSENVNFIQRIGENKPNNSSLPASIQDTFRNSKRIAQNMPAAASVSSIEPKQLEHVKKKDPFLKESKKTLPQKVSFKEEKIETPVTSKRINLKIDDSGISSIKSKNSNNQDDNSKSIDDITKIIRDKLKNLPNF